MTEPTPQESVRSAVKERYGSIAALVASQAGGTSCCGSDPSPARDPITTDLYDAGQLAEVPAAAAAASLGCGNPTALAELLPGEVVLDLGSGAGIDVLLSARRVGPDGFAYGVDFTDEMLDLAKRNAAEQGVTNVEFLRGQIEDVPLPDSSVDVVISNCVINLSTDKAAVIREAFRVLRSGGRFAVSDIVVQGELPAQVRADLEQWVGCIAGALEDTTYRSLLADTGFEEIEIEVTRDHTDMLGDGAAPGGAVVSAFVRARKL
jgi:SAM-dependent methyltransferase